MDLPKTIRFKEGLSPEQKATAMRAAEELLFRKRLKESMVEYCRMMGFEPAKHHLLIIKHLEMIAKDELDLLLIFAPPGSAKSSYVSVLFPAWYMSRNPKHNYLAATHNSEFAAKWGKKVRNDIMTNNIRLEVNVSPDNAAADRWSLVEGGEYMAVGVGSGISGFRADIAAIDDPFGSREDAYSEQVRQKRWDWYLDDFSSRMKPTSSRIIMATRWHEDDLSGRVLQQLENLKKEGFENVRSAVISIPAISESENDPVGRKIGEYLWDEPPYNYGKFLRTRQKEVSPMMWSALFQQRPAPESGDFFKEEWLKPYRSSDIDKRELRVYGASDYAVTADGGDYTVHIVVGLDHTGKMYLIDMWRGQTSPEKWIEEFCRLVLLHAPLEWGEESGQIKSSVGPFLGRRQMELGAYVFRRSFPTKSDKAIRAQAIRGRMAMEGLYILENAPYYEIFRSELLGFPASKHDDCVDALSLIGQMIDHIIPADAPPPPPEKPRFIQDITLDELWENNHLTNFKLNQRI